MKEKFGRWWWYRGKAGRVFKVEERVCIEWGWKILGVFRNKILECVECSII